MEISRKSCRVCLSETDFNVSLFGNYCQKTHMVDKLLVCLKLVIEETDALNTICHKCAENVERYYEFVSYVKKAQTRFGKYDSQHQKVNINDSAPINRRHITSYVREQVYDADYTFSCLEIPNNEEKKEPKASSPFFSYFSPPNLLKKSPEPTWKTPRAREDLPERQEKYKRPKSDRPRHHSRDLFESQSQDIEDAEPKSLDWKLTPDENIIKRMREKCFGRSGF